jgi:hypothetical protein
VEYRILKCSHASQVSYHYQQNESNTDYLNKLNLKLAKCEMTDHQFQHTVNGPEIALRLSKSKKGRDNGDRTGSQYTRTFTDMLAISLFP